MPFKPAKPTAESMTCRSSRSIKLLQELLGQAIGDEAAKIALSPLVGIFELRLGVAIYHRARLTTHMHSLELMLVRCPSTKPSCCLMEPASVSPQ